MFTKSGYTISKFILLFLTLHFITGALSQCVVGQNNCTFCNPGNTLCLNCSGGNWLQITAVPSTQCVYCGTGCLSCASPLGCLQAGSGYYLSTYVLNGMQVTTTTACPPNCTTCDSSGQCHICRGGYTLMTTSNGANFCQDCPLNCTVCSAPAYCLVCDYGYFPYTYPDTSVGCIVCPEYCWSCAKDIGCTNCNNSLSYTPINNTAYNNASYTSCTYCQTLKISVLGLLLMSLVYIVIL